MKDIHSGILAVAALGNALLDADSTSANIDLQGYNAAEIVLSVGVGGIVFTPTNKVEFVLSHSDDGSAFTAVESKDVLGLESVTDGIIKTLDAAHATAAAYRFGYVGNKRYVRLTADFSGTHGAGTPIAGLVIKGIGHNQPEVDQA